MYPKKEAPQFPDLLLHQVGVRGLLKTIIAQTPVTVDTKHFNPPSLKFPDNSIWEMVYIQLEGFRSFTKPGLTMIIHCEATLVYT